MTPTTSNPTLQYALKTVSTKISAKIQFFSLFKIIKHSSSFHPHGLTNLYLCSHILLSCLLLRPNESSPYLRPIPLFIHQILPPRATHRQSCYLCFPPISPSSQLDYPPIHHPHSLPPFLSSPPLLSPCISRLHPFAGGSPATLPHC